MLDKNKIQFFTHENICRVTGKKKYILAKAESESKHMRGRFETNHAPYRCKYCTYFHIGSSTTRRLNHKNRKWAK